MRFDVYQTIKPRKLKLGLIVRIKESVMCADFWDPRSRDLELKHQKTLKNGDFSLETSLFRL